MKNNIPEVEELIKQFARLPGLGPKSAKRIILKLINNKENIVKPLAKNLARIYKNVIRCANCGNLNVIENKLTNAPPGKDDYKFREINFTYPAWKPNEKIRIDKKVEDIQKEYQELGHWEVRNKQRFKYDA